MRWLWFFLGPAVSLAAGISNVSVVGSTNVQSVLSYQAPDTSACTLEVSENANYRPLVHDVDPAVFPGADSDLRTGNLANGLGRVFVIGSRAVEQGADGKWYSRALQAATLHYYRLRCGSETAQGAFRTSNIPTGITYGWPAPQDPTTGDFRWPSTDGNDRNQTVIDPNYGTLIRRVSLPGDRPAYFDNSKKPFSAAAGTHWTSPESALTNDGAAAAYSGTTQDWLVLTNSAFQSTADFYVQSTGLDSITVRIKGSASGSSDELRTIDVCLTLDGAVCKGEIRRLVLTSMETAQTLGGGAPLDHWGIANLSPYDLARNKTFGVMIRASSASPANVSIQYVEVDAAFSDMLYMPDGGFLKVCSAVKSNGGYHCTFVGSRETNHMFWIQPETGEVRWLGTMIATGWGGPDALCGSAFAYFDVSDPNVYYCEAHLDSKTVLLKGTYTGDDIAAKPGAVAPMHWVNLTPPGNTVSDLIQRFDPDYDPQRFPPTLGLMTNHYFVYRAWSGGQDSLAWLAVLDVGNGEPIGQGGTGKIVAATKTFAGSQARWCGLHQAEYLGNNNWVGWDATLAMSGNNDTTGPFQVKLMTPLPASTGTFSVQVSGEPTPYVMDAAVGDVFLITGAPWPGWDMLRIQQKLSATQWVVERTTTNTDVTARPAGTALNAFCGARKLSAPKQGAYLYWDFLNDPTGKDTTGKHYVVERQLTGGHIVQRGNYRIMEATDGYSVITPGFPQSLNTQRTYVISGNPRWSGVYANHMPEGLGNGFMQHESFENYAATEPGRNNWFVDMIPFIGTSYLVPVVKPVAGRNQTYHVTAPQIHPTLFPTFALCGGRQLKDISPGPIGDRDTRTYCVGASCVPGASASDVFVNCPQPVSAKSSCTAYPAGDASSVCVGDVMPYMQSVTQFFLDQSGQGLRNRVLTNAFYAWHAPRTQTFFDTAYSLPDGSWVIFASWANNGRKDLYMVKVPPQPSADADPHWGSEPIQQSLSTNLPAGVAAAQFSYSDSGQLPGTSASQTCSGGTCSVTVSTVPLSLVLAQPLFLDASGNKIGAGQASASIVTGVSGSGIGQPVLASGAPVTNGFSFQPKVAPGSIVSIFGQNLADCAQSAGAPPLPTTMCDASVTFNGEPGHLYYVSGGQINALMPSSLEPGKDVTVVVNAPATASAPFVLPGSAIGAVAPAMAGYTIDGSTLRALVQNSDGTLAGPARPDLNLRPLARGEKALLYANALGATTPTVADGLPAPAAPPAIVTGHVQVLVNGFSEPSVSAELTPGAAGLYQVSFTLDAATLLNSSGDNQLWISVDGTASPRLLLSAKP